VWAFHTLSKRFCAMMVGFVGWKGRIGKRSWLGFQREKFSSGNVGGIDSQIASNRIKVFLGYEDFHLSGWHPAWSLYP
jgi:hypothetical protein